MIYELAINPICHFLADDFSPLRSRLILKTKKNCVNSRYSVSRGSGCGHTISIIG